MIHVGCGQITWRGVPETAAPFVIVAMMALFGGIAHAPLAVMLMVGEMTGNLSLLAPAMLAVGIATWIVGQNSIYTSQLPTRADSPAHRLELSFPLLSTLSVKDAMEPVRVLVHASDSVARVEARLREMEGGVEAGDLRQSGRVLHQRTHGRQVIRLVQRRKRLQRR